MYEIAGQVQRWLGEGRDVLVAQIVETKGFSSRDQAAALAWTAGEPTIGALIDGLEIETPSTPGYAEIAIPDAVAATAGLSCGGTATVLVQSAAALPGELWARLAAREPLCVTVDVSAVGVGEPRLFTPETIREAGDFGGEIPRLFARGTSTTALVEHEGSKTAVVSLWPVPGLLVVGDGLIATALFDAARLLEWSVSVTGDVDDAVTAVEGLLPSDAVVVLSHDRAVDGPSLSAALASHAGYVGALGSRRTQAARREWLTAHEVEDSTVDRIHGPAGLDIDAHTPVEIAVSIVAEIIACRSASDGGVLRDRSGPVHEAGVSAPPPRYPQRS